MIKNIDRILTYSIGIYALIRMASASSSAAPAKFEQQVKRWVSLDNKIKELNDEVRRLRDERNEANDAIFSIVEENKLHNAVIKISDGRLEFKKMKVQSPLSLKYVKECLQIFITDVEQVDSIMTYIRDNREVKMVDDIKRVYNDKGGGVAVVSAHDE